MPRLTTRELAPSMWPDIERLFGANGACGGCWCMFWRLEKADYSAAKGAPARERFRALVESGRAHGVLAYAGDEPVGWCSFDRRTDFLRLDRAPSLACDDAARVWSLPCFFIRRGWRGKGVARLLLRAALEALRGHGARIAEAYPVLPHAGARVATAAAYTGVPALFEPEGFTAVAPRPKGKQRYRRSIR